MAMYPQFFMTRDLLGGFKKGSLLATAEGIRCRKNIKKGLSSFTKSQLIDFIVENQ